ncbi:MAG: hypothetical protein HUJ89_06255 [Bacteroidales bacterium]|nr:hypothetical protein [Bacteroidales bacterium]
MDKTTFETRQRAKEMLEEALSIWRNSPQSDYLDGLENDPMYALLTMALAHQLNRLESDINSVKKDLSRHIVASLIPNRLIAPQPATMVISCNTIDGIDSVYMDEKQVFKFNNQSHTFRPILRTRVLNAMVKKVSRIDGLRWAVTLSSTQPFPSLRYFSFAITGMDFRDLKISLGERELPLIKPWDTHNLPISAPLSIETSIHNNRVVYGANSICYELFAHCDQKIFLIDTHDSSDYEGRKQEITLTFEFSGVTQQTSFLPDNLKINTLVLSNFEIESATLSSKTPIVRISSQYMHMLPPFDEQQFASMNVQVRRVRGDRYDSTQLLELVQTLIERLNMDFYAFQMINNKEDMNMLRRANILLSSIASKLEKQDNSKYAGIYLSIRATPEQSYGKNSNQSSAMITVDYLTTMGAAINDMYPKVEICSPPSEILPKSVQRLGKLVPGKDAVQLGRDSLALAKYYFASHNRIVTPADIRAFCLAELTSRHGLGMFMVEHIHITHRKIRDERQSPYELLVTIYLKDNRYLQANFMGKIRKVEQEMAQTIRARSAQLEPVRVEIIIVEDNKQS